MFVKPPITKRNVYKWWFLGTYSIHTINTISSNLRVFTERRKFHSCTSVAVRCVYMFQLEKKVNSVLWLA